MDISGEMNKLRLTLELNKRVAEEALEMFWVKPQRCPMQEYD